MSDKPPSPFLTIVREERQFSFLLAHLLLQRGPSLEAFLRLVDNANGTSTPVEPTAALTEAEIYVEYAFLRDEWFDLGVNSSDSTTAMSKADCNARKRGRVVDLLESLRLNDLAKQLPDGSPAEFNEFFMATAGSRIVKDIASPALWSVKGLAQNFGHDPHTFLQLCKLKWAFHIKPDIVILRPSRTALCIEAKLESGEGNYPSGEDAKTFDQVMGPGHRVGQFALQSFLFEEVLGVRCLPVIIQKTFPAVGVTHPLLTWGQVFSELAGSEEQRAGSIPFVGRLMTENRALLSSYANHRLSGG